MKPLLLMVAIVAVLVAACSGSGGADATDEAGSTESETTTAETTVGETTMPETTVGETTTTDDGEGLGRVAATVGGIPISVGAVEGLTFDSAKLSPVEFAQYLGAVIQWRVVEQTATEQFGFEATEEDVEAEFDRLLEELGGGADLDEFLETRNVSEQVLRESAVQELARAAVREAVSADVDQPTIEEAEQGQTGSPMEWTTVCVAHILVPTEEEATAVVARLDAGEAFAVVAEEVSIDPGSGAEGGDLGCTSPIEYVPAFSEATMSAEIGAVGERLETQFGFHVIRVDSRELATIEEIRERMLESRLDTAVSDWYLETLGAAQVTVVRDYGSWVQEPSPHVEPPG